MAQPGEYTRRLEYLRHLLGIGTVQRFVDRLNETQKEPIPYATARRYHRDREPPIDYLRNVANAFDSPLEWLMTGEGFPKLEQAKAAAVAEEMGLREHGMRFVKLIYDQLGLPGLSYPEFVPPWAAQLASIWARTGLNEELVIAIRETLDACGLRPENMDQEQLEEFVVAMMPALMVIARLKRESHSRAMEYFKANLADTEEESDGE